ncbi:MAG: hypothetical protein IJ333_04225, partial [Clostridia bacterium]|nr:hypothetical protein [Clostridia bacterium]
KEFEFLYYMIITIVYAITFATIMPFINIYTYDITDINYNSPLLGFLFVLNGLLYNLKTPRGMLVISAGLYKETKKQTITQALIAVIGGLVLAPKFSIAGIMLGSIISNLYRDIDLLFFIPKQVTKTPVMNTLRRMIRIFFCLIFSTLPLQFISFTPQNFLSWALYAAVIGIWTCLVTFLINFIFDKQEFKNILLRFKLIRG